VQVKFGINWGAIVADDGTTESVSYNRAEFVCDVSRVWAEFRRGNSMESSRTVGKIKHCFSCHIARKARKYIMDSYDSGRFRYNAEDYQDPNYRPDPRKRPYEPVREANALSFRSQDSASSLALSMQFDWTWTMVSIGKLLLEDGVTWVKEHVIASIAIAVFTYYLPLASVGLGLGYVVYRILD